MYHHPISVNNNILSVSPFYDGASDIHKAYSYIHAEQTSVLVETTVLVELKGLTIFSTKQVGCCTILSPESCSDS